MPRQTSVQITEATARQAAQLRQMGFGTFTDIVRIAIDRMSIQEGNAMNHKPTCTEIAESFALWSEYVDPDATMTEAQFDAMTTAEKVALIHEMFPNDCHCEQ